MGRGNKLNESEIRKIIELKNQNLNVSQIAKIVNRSRKVVYNLLKDPENYGKKKSSGRPPTLSERNKRAIIRIASNSALTSREIACQAGVTANIRSVRRVLQRCKFIQRLKMKQKPPLTKQHKKDRLTFAKDRIQWKKKWKRILFTDEKKFNLDGPDGFSYYYHDLRKEKIVKQRRQMGGGGVMIWAGIGCRGKTDVQFINGKMNSKKYIELISEQISKHAQNITKGNFIFQHDNAAIHKAKIVNAYFTSQKIEVLPWPARSPDLNIIENCWGELARAVYKNGKQYDNIHDLKVSIVKEWDNLSQELIRKLFKSLPNPMIEFVENQGGYTHY